MNRSSLSAARTPFVRLLVPLLAGIICQEWGQLPLWACVLPALGGLVLWSFFITRDSIEEQYHKRALFGWGLFLLVFAIGAGLHGIQNRPAQPPAGFYPLAIAHIDDEAEEKTRSFYCPVTITALSDTSGTIVEYNEKVALYFEKCLDAQHLVYGDIISFEFRPQPIRPNTNPYAFDFASFMKHKGISRSQYIAQQQWIYLGEKPQSKLWAFTSSLQRKLSEQIESCHLSPHSASLLKALLLGERQKFPQELRQYFSAAGLSHILAVSGLHMGVMATLIYFLLFPLSYSDSYRKLRPLLTLLALWLYACVTGLSPSTIRACIMASFLLTAEMLDRRNSSLNALFASAFFMLLYNTSLVFDIGFQMSFLAVAGILLFYNRLNFWGRSPYYPVRWISSCVAVSIAAQIGALPVAVYYFHTIPLLFLIGNIFVLPLLPFIFGFSFLMLVLSSLHLPYEWLATAIDFVLRYIERLSFHIDRIPWSHIDGVWLNRHYLWFYFIGGLLLYITIKNRSKKGLWLTLGFCIVFFIADISTYQSSGHPEMVVYDSRETTVVQLSDRNGCYILMSDTLVGPQRLVGEEHRMKNRHEEYRLFQETASPFKGNAVYIDYPFALFHGKRLLLLDRREWRKSSTDKPLDIDYAIVSKMFKGRVTDITRLFRIRALIIGADVHPGRAMSLQNDCFEQGIPCYDIRSQGAWVARP